MLAAAEASQLLMQMAMLNEIVRVAHLRIDPVNQQESLVSRPLTFSRRGMALLPFLIIMVTSFVKISVVLSIVRSALGTQQMPPTQVITGLSIILTIHVMTQWA